jgi:putative DNA primase/helicase
MSLHYLILKNVVKMTTENITEFTKKCTDFEQIPAELKDYDQWLLWKIEPQLKGRPKKVPYTISGYKASSTNPETWSSFDEVFEIYQKSAGAYSGIGFVFTKEDPYICIDYDHIIDSIGIIDPEISEEIKIYNSYSEISQSGTGIHVIVTGTVPGSRKRGNGREIYGDGQFIAITGNHLKFTPVTVNEASEEAIKVVYDKMIKPIENSGKSKMPAEEHSKESKTGIRSGIPDFDVLEKCRSGKNAGRFNTVYGGNWGVLEYSSQSEADLALCSMFAAHTQDSQQIDRLFTGSGLYREKWGRTDYKGPTISKALERTNEDPRRKYFSEGRFVVKSLADELMRDYHFITFDDNHEIYYYENGIYRHGGENLIIQVAQAKLGDYTSKRHREEVKSYIQYATMIRRDLVDNEPYILNLRNGLYDLKQDKFKPHTPDLLSTVQLPVKYDPIADCPNIETFLSDVVSEKDKQVLYEWTGYSMIPDTRIQRAVMLVGSGSNGKGVFLQLLTAFIGKENTSEESLQSLGKDKFAPANLHRKLLNIFPDLPSSDIEDNSAFKMLTGGDLIRGEKKYETAFKFRNTARLIFSANQPPWPKDAGYAYFRRWMLIEFPHKFEGKSANKSLISSLTTEKEMSGLLNKAIVALKEVLAKEEFSYDKTVAEVEKMYCTKSNNVAAFADECVKMSSEDASKAVIYAAYVNWCKKNNEKPVTNAEFGKKFRVLGYQSFREPQPDSNGKRNYYWEGVSVGPM